MTRFIDVAPVLERERGTCHGHNRIIGHQLGHSVVYYNTYARRREKTIVKFNYTRTVLDAFKMMNTNVLVNSQNISLGLKYSADTSMLSQYTAKNVKIECQNLLFDKSIVTNLTGQLTPSIIQHYKSTYSVFESHDISLCISTARPLVLLKSV